MSMQTRSKPGVLGFLVGGIIIFIGIASCGGLIFTGVMSVMNSGQQLVVPGEYTVVYEKPGRHMIYHEYRSVIDGKVYDTGGQISGLECRLFEKRTGNEIALEPATMSTTYSAGSREGVGIFNVDIPEAGEYMFTARYPEGVEGVEAVLAIGTGGGQLFMGILLALLVLFVCTAVGGGLIIYTFIRRVNAGKTVPATTFEPGQ